MPDRFYLGDTHVHSLRSDGRLSPEELALVGSARGLDFLGLTDHSDARGPRVRPAGLCVLPGQEVSTGGRIHFVLLGFDQPVPRFKVERLPDVARQVHAAGGAVILAHPWMAFAKSPDRLYHLDRGFAEGHIDGLEVFSGALKPAQFDLWRRMLRRYLRVWAHSRPATLASSDWHRRSHGRAVGQACTYVAAPGLSVKALVQAIVNRRTVAALLVANAVEDGFTSLPFPAGSKAAGQLWQDNLCGPQDLVRELLALRDAAWRRLSALTARELTDGLEELAGAARAAAAAGNYRRALALLDRAEGGDGEWPSDWGPKAGEE